MSSATNTTDTEHVLEQQLYQAHLASREESTRLSREFYRVKTESKQLRADADALDEKSKRLRAQANELEKQKGLLGRRVCEAESLAETLEYERLYLALRRNDAETTTVEGTPPMGHAQRLGEELHQNTHVSNLNLWTSRLLPISNEKLSLEEISEYLQPMTSFIRNSIALRRFSLKWNHANQHIHMKLVAELLQASCDNRHLEELCLDVTIPTLTLVNVLSSTFVTRLAIGDTRRYGLGDRRMISEAFAHNASLESLHINSAHATTTVPIFIGLRDGRSRLTELKLVDCFENAPLEVWQTLAAYLRSTTRLQHLHFDGVYEFNPGSMTELVNGLQRRDGDRTIISISKLTFQECHFDSDALRVLKTFMQTKTESMHGSTSVVSSLKELVYNIDDREPLHYLAPLSMNHLTQRDDEGSDVTSKWYPTIGSQIHTVSLPPVVFHQFLRNLARSADRVHIATLHLTYVREYNATELTDCISKITSLRHLRIGYLDDVHVAPIVRSLKDNGTLHSVSIPGEIESRLVQAYCQRNEHLGKLLRRRTDATKSTVADLLCPALFEVAMQITRTRSSAVLMGLLNMRDSIGQGISCRKSSALS